MNWLFLALVFWIAAWGANILMARSRWSSSLPVKIFVPMLFGLTVLVLWEALVYAFSISQAILPAPSAVAQTFANSTDLLWVDFSQTVLKGALRGYFIGAAAAFVTAILIDRSAF